MKIISTKKGTLYQLIKSAKIKVWTIILFFIFSSVWNIAFSQVVVEKSKDKVIISGSKYYIHIVKKGETAYSISKAYGITVDELIKNNRDAASGVKEGQALRIPVIEAEKPTTPQERGVVKKDESKYIYHKLRPGETVYSLARSYGVSVQDIISSNPGLEINKLPVNYEIAIPMPYIEQEPEISTTPKKEYIDHKVVKGESLSSIAEKYGISVMDIRRENKGLIFPRVDNIIKIPVERAAETSITTEVIADTLKTVQEEPEIEFLSEKTPVKNLRGEYNVAVLLPLFLKENSVRTEIDSSQIVKGKPVYKVIVRPEQWIYPASIPFLELYIGVLLAADTLRSLGLDLNIYAFDTEDNTMSIESLINSGQLKKMDLIIGPVFSTHLLKIAEYTKPLKIPVVSPVPLRNNTPLVENNNIYMAIPSIEVAQKAIAKRAGKFKDANFIYIYTDNSIEANTQTNSLKNLLLSEINSDQGADKIMFKELLFISRSALPADSTDRLEQSLSSDRENIVIIDSEDHSVLSETIMTLHPLINKYNIHLIGYPAMRELVNLDPKLYFDLGIELYSNYWIDYSQEDVKRFLKVFRNKFLTEPQEVNYAWIGYDIMYYFVSGYAIHGKKFFSRPHIHNPDLLETKFEFRQKSSNDGFENQHLYLIKYTDTMDIILPEDEAP
ncbi:MAG: LysM peptidoglycan-binding domain-containing protein [Bacteroidales bacterium]|nr:LysM peptidoglycan-binding domain-containing protein [Bacteroidales bacterium]